MKWFKEIRWILLTLIGVGLMLLLSYQQEHLQDNQYYPSLPRPIAEEMLLITSAGQSTDTYIIKDVANKLMLHNYFMPQATDLDLEDIKSIAFVVGYSAIGEKLHEISIEDEIERVEGLLTLSQRQDIKIITFYVGGKQRRSEETDRLLREIGKVSDYIITTKDGDHDQFITEIARENDVPITLVNEITDVSEPFASAYR